MKKHKRGGNPASFRNRGLPVFRVTGCVAAGWRRAPCRWETEESMKERKNGCRHGGNRPIPNKE